MSYTPCPCCANADAQLDHEPGGRKGSIEGWLHPSRDYPGLLHCNCCGQYYVRDTRGTLVSVLPGEKVGREICSTVVGG